MRIAHISDPHFGTEDPPVCDALGQDLLREAPDLVILTGDITQRARSAQFRAARAFIESLAPLPVLAVPGNHDLPLFDLFTRLSTPYRRFRRHICGSLSPTWERDDVAVLGVNSTRVLRHKHGNLPRALVESVARRLERVPQTFKIVALHHPLAIVEQQDLRNRVRNADDALTRWGDAGADLFLGGHIHLPYCVCSAHARRALIVQAGTAVSTRRRGGQPNSYNLIRLESAPVRRIVIQRREHSFAEATFAASSRTTATFDGRCWALLSPAPREPDADGEAHRPVAESVQRDG